MSSSPQPAGAGKLGLFWMTVVIFGITTTLHGLAPLATYGFGAIFFLLLAGVGFLIPAGLVAVHLTTAFPREGGVYIWVGEALGKDWAFLATWLQWLQNVIFWTVTLTGSAAMLAYGFGWTRGADNSLFVAGIVLGCIWVITGMTARGLGSTGVLGWTGSLFGTILPGLLLIVVAAAHVFSGGHSYLTPETSSFLPDLSNPANLSFAISAILIFAGIELMGTRIREMKHPRRHFPVAVFLAIFLTLLLLVPVVLAISILVPPEELNIAAGLVQAVQQLFPPGSFWWWVPAFFAVALLLDAIGEIAGWMAGTPISMAAAGRDGFLPRKLGERTGETAPSMLIAQACIGSLVSVVFLVTPGVQSTFWVLSALLVQLYVLMYLLLFLSAWQLRGSKQTSPEAWPIPGGSPVLLLICLLGGILSLLVFVAGFIRPASLHEIGEIHYLLVLATGLFLSLGTPCALILWRKHQQRKTS